MTKDSLTSTTATKKPIVALDCDGVLLDYNATFGHLYEKTFGKKVSIVSPKSYRVSVSPLNGSQTFGLLSRFARCSVYK